MNSANDTIKTNYLALVHPRLRLPPPFLFSTLFFLTLRLCCAPAIAPSLPLLPSSSPFLPPLRRPSDTVYHHHHHHPISPPSHFISSPPSVATATPPRILWTTRSTSWSRPPSRALKARRGLWPTCLPRRASHLSPTRSTRPHSHIIMPMPTLITRLPSPSHPSSPRQSPCHPPSPPPTPRPPCRTRRVPLRPRSATPTSRFTRCLRHPRPSL